ncbi:MAG: DUF3320 domain-containing protein [Pseudomonadota bacterium]|nr:DUF3320 domain-containing protein [Pseudomonadota bacterium]
MADQETVASVKDRLLRDRHALLDLSTRNRLLNVPMRTRNVRTIEIVDERAAEVHRLLTDGKGLSFLPGRMLSDEERAELAEDDVETGGIPQPDDEDLDERGLARRHADLRLQTKLTSEGLQKRLFDIWYDARTLEEEQGVNILYLGLGLLRWYDADSSEVARHAPLVLLPVQLDRTSAAEKFKLRGRGEPPSPNLSLQAKMKAEFGFVIEDFADEDELDVGAYCARVAATVSSNSRWEVLPDAMVLGFFSFAKFLMYRDLDPENWPAETPIDQHAIIAGLLRDGFPDVEPIVPDDTAPIDPAIPPVAMNHVVDADSSQTLVIEEAARGRTLVVKGPPGTGKSQTITNIIAAAAAQGKRVLFVAEKMAALDVVHRRLKSVGLGPLTLELHSNKANKRAVLDELKRTKELVLRSRRVDTGVPDALKEARDVLNAHADRLHEVQEPYRLSAFHIIGNLIRTASGQGGYQLDRPETWTPAERDERRALMAELRDRLVSIGSPSEHPWRGTGCGALDPAEQEDLLRRVRWLKAELAALQEAAMVGQTELGLTNIVTVADLSHAAKVLKVAVGLPDADRPALSDPRWVECAAAVLSLPSAGAEHVSRKSKADAPFQPIAWDADLTAVRTALVTKGRSLFRFLDGNYRAQIALLRSYLKAPLPNQVDERIALVDLMMSAQAARAAYGKVAPAGPAYGRLWQEEESDWSRLQAVADWRRESLAQELSDGFLGRLAAVEDPQSLAAASSLLAQRLEPFRAAWTKLVEILSLDVARAFGTPNLDEVPLVQLAERMDRWLAAPEAVTRWIAFAERAWRATELGLGSLVEAVLEGRLGGEALVPTFERSYFEALRSDVFGRMPELKSFDGELHDRLVERFQSLDLARIELAREEIAHSHWNSMPRGNSGIGPLGVLNGELAKRRNLLPIRQLVEKAGPAIQKLKPIFMMSPLSVAQFLKPGAITFDLLVMDEASQIEPVDALGAVARATQIVVVGDERQLPPTRFFAKLTGDDAEEDEESEEYQLRASAVESVLDLCLAKGVPDRMLSWHYRSKHQSLIAVSNREFYDNRLFIVPSPYDAVAGMGLKFHHLPHAHYDRGNTRTNPIEARTVAEAVIAHARTSPGQSLGVATFSTAQRQAILKELELLRRAHPGVEDFFGRGGAEPFFVKNLENIQGDERDVIFISVGYGKTATGYLAMSFGPLNGEGGERRLNVLISRAKLRCEVFSSITGDDIDLERARSRGVAALKMFLSFAQTGKLGIAEETGRDPDSVFEEEVAAKLRSLGYDVKAQIGVAGFFVDLAISDPEKPGRFVIGIECDGAQYHSSRSARDRDRLRQAVLESHGWIIHRIWSTDWYLRPREELAKVQTAVEAAIAAWRERDENVASLPHVAVPLQFSVEAVDEHEELIVGNVGHSRAASPVAPATLAVPYMEAEFAVDRSLEPHLIPTGLMAKYVAQVVDAEGPIHQDEIVTRIRLLWGLGRAGSRIRDAVAKGIGVASATGAICGGPEFWACPDAEVKVRDRSEVGSASVRRPEAIPPVEIEHAVLAIVTQNFGALRDQVVQAVARLLGFASTSAQLRGRILDVVDGLLAAGKLREQTDLLVVAPPPAVHIKHQL